MANLRVDKITSTETFETTGSVQFDGSGDYLSLGSSADFDFETGDFTIEAFLFPPTTQVQYANIVCQATTGDAWYFSFTTSNTLTFSNYSTNYIISSSTLSTGVWSHVAVSRKGTSLKMYINGIEVGSTTNSVSLGVTANVNIGFNGVSHYFNGHISNLRILKGKALYTENFTPPTRELTVTPETVLLACQHKTDASHEKTGKTITVNGNAVANELTPGLLTDVVKSGGSSAITGSVFFDGNDDLTVADSDDFHLNGNYTIECFINRSVAPGTEVDFVSIWGASDKGFLLYINTSNKFGYAVSNDGTNVTNYGAGSTTIGAHEWHHLAVTNDGTTVRIFVNGVLEQSGATVTMNNSSRDLVIGAETSQGSYDLQGFISNLRIVKGTALYTDNFIPPTRELKKVPGTVLLCCQDENSVTTEATGKTITSNGDPAASNFTPQVGNDGSVEFVGTTKINTENYFYLPTGDTESRGGNRGLMGGGVYSGNKNIIEYITIQSTGNATDFGDLTVDRRGLASCSSSTRGIWGGGIGGSPDTFKDTLDYVTISSTGNAQSFGNLTESLRQKAALSNSTRGIFAGGYNPTHNSIIEYITISSTGSAKIFGDLSANKSAVFACSSQTRGIFGGGSTPTPATTYFNVIEYITISSTGNAIDFGDLTVGRGYGGGCSNPTRGVFGAGTNPQTNVVDYVTISSTGDAQDFGDLSLTKSDLNAFAGSDRGIFFGGYSSPNPVAFNTIDYITISSTGNYKDFGDLTLNRTQLAGCSNGHGGLG